MAILKILLYILLSVLALLVLLLLANVKISLSIGKKFNWRLTVGGIKITPSLFAKKKKKKKKKKKEPARDKVTKAEKKPKKKTDTELIMKLLSALSRELPRAFRINLKKLSITVGKEDAAAAALEYGALYASLSGALALLDGYRGLFYGFRTRREKIRLDIDYTSTKTKAEAYLTISCFTWQLLFAAVRLGMVYLLNTIEHNNERTEN